MLKRIDGIEKYEYHRFLGEVGETRFPKISFVLDLYDTENYKGWKNYYTPKNPLTEGNKIKKDPLSP